MSSVPSQGFSCNRNNKLYRSMMSKSQTKDLNKVYEVSSHDYHCCRPDVQISARLISRLPPALPILTSPEP